MPRVGVPNNASGVNGWSGFGDEEPYGQATKDAELARGAPLAGARLASGPIAAPKRAGRQAQRGTAPQPVPVAPPSPGPPPVVSPEAQLAQRWQAIAAIPGASPLVQEYAAIAMRRLGPNVNLVNAAWGGHPGSGATVGGKAGQGQSGLPPKKLKA